MRYVVKAGSVSAETQINERGSRATVDHPRGSVLPDDVPAEQLQGFLARGAVEPLDDEPEFELDPEEAEIVDDPDAINLDELDKKQLLAIAKDKGVQVDGRANAETIVAAIRENQ